MVASFLRVIGAALIQAKRSVLHDTPALSLIRVAERLWGERRWGRLLQDSQPSDLLLWPWCLWLVQLSYFFVNGDPQNVDGVGLCDGNSIECQGKVLGLCYWPLFSPSLDVNLALSIAKLFTILGWVW